MKIIIPLMKKKMMMSIRLIVCLENKRAMAIFNEPISFVFSWMNYSRMKLVLFVLY